MRKLLLSLILILFFFSSAISDNGLINIKSAHSVKVTADHFENSLKMKGDDCIYKNQSYRKGQKGWGKVTPNRVNNLRQS